MARYPVTVAAVMLVTAGFALQWFVPLEALLERDGQAIESGQWWRLVTSVFVSGSGWGQYLFNTFGIAVVGAAVERTRGAALWLVAALVAQVGASLVALAWAPDVGDSGSSLVVGGLVGALTVTRFVQPTAWAATATGYRVFFPCYLAGLALAGPVAGAIAGSVLTGIAVSLVLRSRFAAWVLAGALALGVAASVTLVFARDQHGVAVLLGVAVALAAGRGHRDEQRRPPA